MKRLIVVIALAAAVAIIIFGILDAPQRIELTDRNGHFDGIAIVNKDGSISFYDKNARRRQP